jgi:cell wall-associated NlpC family hydrolase
MTRLAALLLFLTVLTTRVAGQGVEGQVGRFYESGGWTIYRLGFSQPLSGVFGSTLHGDYLRRVGDDEGGFAGIGADLTAFRGGSEGPYLVAGLGGGVGSPHSRSFSSFWGSWSAGAGWELFPASFLAVGAEGRWRELSLDARDGFELSAGISIRLGGRSGRSADPPSRQQPLAEANSPDTPATPGITRPIGARVTDSVIATATEAMGRPYQFGGTGQDGEGFDCSGLIQYAYGRHGITLPRRSAEQAREGTAVPKKLKQLTPGDLLTFSNRGGPVTHVGLYIGDGRFIHSATRGVHVSVLSAEDPYGRWWFKRWVGVRRIVK